MRKFFVALALVFLITVTTMATVDMTGSQTNPANEANINPVKNCATCCCMTINSLNAVQLQNTELVINETTAYAIVNVVQDNSNLTNNLSSMITSTISGSTLKNYNTGQLITSWTAQNIVLSNSLNYDKYAAVNLSQIELTNLNRMAPDIVYNSYNNINIHVEYSAI